MKNFGHRLAAHIEPLWERRPPPIGRWSTVEFDRVGPLHLFSDTHETLLRIESSAQESIRTRDYLGALWKYSCAVFVCVKGNQSESLPALRAKCAKVALLVRGEDEVDSLIYAYKQAYLSVKAKSDADETYYMLAEAAKRLILMGNVEFVASTNPVVDAIKDYYKCFTINPERVDAFVEAMVLAVDHGLGDSSLAVLSSKHISDGTAVVALNYILQRIENFPPSTFKVAHLEHFLFNVVPPTASLGDVPVVLCRLVKRGVTGADILNRMIQIGVRFIVKDIKELLLNAEETDDLVKIISSSMAHSSLSSVHLKSAAEAAIKSNKIRFLACLITHGATPAIADITKLADLSDPVVLNYLFATGSPDKVVRFLIKALSLAYLRTNGTCFRFGGSNQRCEEDGSEEVEDKPNGSVPNAIVLFKNFIQCGKPLCGKDAVAGIREMICVALTDIATRSHVKLLCLLLNCGANSLDLCQARFKKATPLHVATELALESGIADIISAVMKCADFTLPGDGRVIDKNGDCPYHLVVKSKRDDSVKLKVCVALSQLDPPLDPTVSDACINGRQAKEYAGGSNEVFNCLVTAELRFVLVHITSELAMNGILSELKKARDIWECVGILENVGMLAVAVEILEKVGMREEALKQVLKYGTKLADIGVECLAHKYAALYSTQKNTAMLETILAYIPDHSAKARYWRKCGHYEKAIEIYIEKNMFEHAFRLMSCLGWYDRGLQLARKENDKKWIVNFAVEGAKASLHDHQTLDTGALECLKDLLRDRDVSGHNKLVPIIHLLVGCGGGKAEHVFKAAQMFGEQGNIIGEIESCMQLLRLLKDNDAADYDNCRRQTLRACFTAQQHAYVLLRSVRLDSFAPPVQRAFQLALVFYGVRLSGTEYHIHPKQSVWIGGSLKLRQVSKGLEDDKGMVRLNVVEAKQHFIEQLGRLSNYFSGDNEIKRKLQADLCSVYRTKLYRPISSGLLLKGEGALKPDHLRRYVSVHINWLEYCYILQQSTDGPIRQLLTLFSPNVSPHLPPGLLHLKLVRSSTLACESIFKWLSRALGVMATSEESKADVWLMLWKASCIVGKGGEELRTLVKDLAHKVDDNDVVPVPYLFLDRYIHQFDFWLQSCDLICNHGEIIASAESVIKYFLPHIAVTAKRGSQIMVMNVVEILSIHSTALLGVIMRSQHRLSGKAPVFVVPRLYECVIETFDELNTYGRGGYRLLEACVHQADICPEGDLKRLSSNALQLLRHSLDLLLGVLKFSLCDPKLLSSGFSCHCLILSLTIVANLVPLPRHDPTLLHRFVEIIRVSNVVGCPHYITDAYNIMSVSDWSRSAFKLIQSLTNKYNLARPGLVQMMVCGEAIEFCPVVFSISDPRGPQPINGTPRFVTCVLKPHERPKSTQHGDSDNSEASQSSEVLSEDHQQTGGDTLVTHMEYCCACNLHLERSQMEEHITTAAHQQKVQLLQEYNTMERECLQLQQRLHAALQHLQDDDNRGNQCAKQTHDMEEELERNSSIFDDIRWRSSWEVGVKELKQMKERVGMLCQPDPREMTAEE